MSRQKPYRAGGDFRTRAGGDQSQGLRRGPGDCQQHGIWPDGRRLIKDRQKLEKAADEFFVGNLYFNRKCTGALVGGHPFGGFNMSGTDSKAGGRDYLLLFTQAKVVSEKLAQ